nr:MAG TPA: hypothetical protein [Caudoviricetes sp.]
MTPIRSSDHAEYRYHCSHFGAAAECSAWAIRGFAPERRPRLGDAHAEQSASHIISLRERVSIRETLSPLDEPSTFREKRKGRRAIGRVRPPRCGGPSARPLGETGYRLSGWSRFPDQTPVVETGGLSDPGGISDRGYPVCGGCSDGVYSGA